MVAYRMIVREDFFVDVIPLDLSYSGPVRWIEFDIVKIYWYLKDDRVLNWSISVIEVDKRLEWNDMFNKLLAEKSILSTFVLHRVVNARMLDKIRLPMRNVVFRGDDVIVSLERRLEEKWDILRRIKGFVARVHAFFYKCLFSMSLEHFLGENGGALGKGRNIEESRSKKLSSSLPGVLDIFKDSIDNASCCLKMLDKAGSLPPPLDVASKNVSESLNYLRNLFPDDYVSSVSNDCTEIKFEDIFPKAVDNVSVVVIFAQSLRGDERQKAFAEAVGRILSVMSPPPRKIVILHSKEDKSPMAKLSYQTAKNIYNCLEKDRYNVEPVYHGIFINELNNYVSPEDTVLVIFQDYRKDILFKAILKIFKRAKRVILLNLCEMTYVLYRNKEANPLNVKALFGAKLDNDDELAIFTYPFFVLEGGLS